PGRSSITVSLGELRADVAVEVVPVPASITVLGGEDQRAAAGHPLAAPVPAVNAADALGTVHPVWTLDPVPGRQQLAIAVDGVAVSPVVTAEADPVPAKARVAL